MNSDSESGYLAGLNQHGYSFHQRVIAETAKVKDKFRGRWDLFSIELPISIGERNGRIDFVLSYQPRPDLLWLMVAECKRVNPAFGRWCFAKGSYQRPSFLKSQLMVELLKLGEPIHSGGHGFESSDRIYDIGYAIKTNTTGDSHPVSADKDSLEAACSQITLGLNGLLQSIRSNAQLRDSLGPVETVTVVPVIFTTAKLSVSDIELKSADLETGELSEPPATREVDWLYYQYSQSPSIRHDIESLTKQDDSWERIVARSYVRSIAIVNALGIEDYIRCGWLGY